MRVAIITGASSGVGRMFFDRIATHREALDEIWVIARREAPLRALQEKTHLPVRSIPCDLTTMEGLAQVQDLLAQERPQIRLLVNAAGYGKIGSVSAIPLQDNIGMVDLNCRALTAMCRMTMPYWALGAQIYNIASVAGFLPQPDFAVYAASKAYVISFSRALHEEMRRQGVTVVAACPNPMETSFFERAGGGTSKPFKAIGYEQVSDVVDTALDNGARGRDLSLSSPFGKAIRVGARVLPHRLVMRVERYFL